MNKIFTAFFSFLLKLCFSQDITNIKNALSVSNFCFSPNGKPLAVKGISVIPIIIIFSGILISFDLNAQSNEKEEAQRYQQEAARRKAESDAKAEAETKAKKEAKAKAQQAPQKSSQGQQGRQGFGNPFKRLNAEASVARPVRTLDEDIKETLDWMIQEFGGDVSPFSDPLANVEKFSENGKFGFRTFDQKKVMIPAELDLVWEEIFEHCYIVHKGGLAGTINVNGEISIPLVYASLTPFFPERPAKFDDKKYHSNNYVNDLLIEKTLSRYIAKSKKNGQFGIIDAYNRLVVPFEYDTIFVHSNFFRKNFLNEKVLNLVKNGKTVIYDCHFRSLIPESEKIEELVQYYDFAGEDYLFRVKKDGLTGIYFQGKMIIAPLYRYITPFSVKPIESTTSQIQFIVTRPDSMSGIVDIHHQLIIPFNQTTLTLVYCQPNLKPFLEPGYYHYSCYSKQNKWQLIHFDGHLIAEFPDLIPEYFIPSPTGEDFFYGESIPGVAPDNFFYYILSPKGDILHRLKKDYAIFQQPGKNPVAIKAVTDLEKKYEKQHIVCYIFDRELQKMEYVLLSDGQLITTQ